MVGARAREVEHRSGAVQNACNGSGFPRHPEDRTSRAAETFLVHMRARNKVILRSCHRGLIESWATSFRFCAKHKVGLVLSAVHPTEDSRPSCVLSPKDCAPSAADRRLARGVDEIDVMRSSVPRTEDRSSVLRPEAGSSAASSFECARFCSFGRSTLRPREANWTSRHGFTGSQLLVATNDQRLDSRPCHSRAIHTALCVQNEHARKDDPKENDVNPHFLRSCTLRPHAKLLWIGEVLILQARAKSVASGRSPLLQSICQAKPGTDKDLERGASLCANQSELIPSHNQPRRCSPNPRDSQDRNDKAQLPSPAAWYLIT